MTQSEPALVTGGSRGPGRDIALSLARRGIDIVLTYNTDVDKAESVVAEIQRAGGKAAALLLDLSQVSSLDGFLARLKATLRERWNTESIDFLANNAGIGAAVPIAELTEETFDAFANIHFKSVVCKAAVEVFTRYVAKEYGPRKIRANVVAPGGIETDFAGGLIRSSPELQAYLTAQMALGRVSRPDDIGGAVAFLCTDDAKWIIGQGIEVTVTSGIYL